jgi:RNA polymerase sigma-70 factor (ECF subfamily)
MSRTVTAHLFSSVNGVAEGPDQFQLDAFGLAEGELMGKAIAGVEDVVIGRKLWAEWSQYWPGAEDPFGEFINTVRSLFTAGAIDALTFTMRPVAPNAGRRLVYESAPLTRLRLVDSTITPAGNAVLTYALRGES